MTDGAGTAAGDYVRASPLPWAASGTVLAMALLLAGIRASNAGPFDPILGNVAFLMLFATPGLVGGLAAISGRRRLYIAAAASLVVLSLIGFAGETLPLLIPTICFLLLAAEPRASANRARAVRLRTAGLALVGSIVVLVSLMVVGAFVTAAVALAVALLARAPLDAALPSRGGFIAGLVAVGVVALVIGSLAVLLTSTETVCWTKRDTSMGPVYSRVPESETMSVGGPTGLSAAGCDGGVLTTTGSLASLSLDALALGLAASVALERRRLHSSRERGES